MRILFFSSADKSGRAAFKSYYTLQNLKAVKTISLIYFLFSVLIRIIFFTYNLPNQTISHINEYDAANWISLLSVPVFYMASIMMVRHFTNSRNFLIAAQSLVFLFSLFVIISTMRATFFSMYNPRNTMVMYMVGLILVGLFFTFEYYETIFITLATGIIFIIILPYYQHSFNELVLNNLASLLLLTAFFCISRYLFSYKADNFFKLKAIEEKNIEVASASQAKNEILGVVAHDLRNPLAIIKSVTALMEMDEGPADDYLENIQIIKTSCDKATSIINDLLETAQNEIITVFDLERTELGQFLQIIVNEWLQSKKGQVDITYHSLGRPVYAHIHNEKMQRVMDNLISNAIKFSGKNNRIEISVSDSNKEVFIHVKDFGIGIPSEILPYIFDRFSKARRDGIRGEVSVGLGLSIVQQLVKKHDGEIEARNNDGQGTTFTIKLPKA